MAVHQLLRESVLLTLIKGDDRIDRMAIINALGQLVPVSDIDSLGTLGNFSEWYVIVNSKDARQDILKNVELTVGEQVFMISEPYKHVKTIRLLNVPPSVSDEEIRAIVSSWGGTVLNVECERLPRPYEAIKSFVRRVRIRFSCRQDESKVPISVRSNGLSFAVQLEGRQKVCYRCKQAGHTKATCEAIICQKCHELGHDDSNCQRGKRSYATVTASTPGEANPPSIRDEQATPDPGLTFTDQRINLPSLPKQQRVLVCRKCKQVGHKKKECPQLPTPSLQTEKLDKNDQHNMVEDTQQASSECPVVNQEQEKENNASSAELTQTTTIDESENVTTFASSLQHRIMYEAYKNPNNEFKRTCADRSIDSDFDTDPKKQHTHDSSSSMIGEHEKEDGEVIER